MGLLKQQQHLYDLAAPPPSKPSTADHPAPIPPYNPPPKGSNFYYIVQILHSIALLSEKCCKGQQEDEDQPPRNMKLAIRNDEELGKLLQEVKIASGGVLPNINPFLLPKKTSAGGGDNASKSPTKIPT
ncbi:hypothetical protein RJ640_013232 [Escallonia rubra]|uniref:Histone H2A C-terminal domain-containing protein n=1 Tax=Escallonia rubra TaxID=112253 RepID=A0AA88UNP8_9ASTE|nr:hypothetical protein RJ640_013232 [Escallonia rubra]